MDDQKYPAPSRPALGVPETIKVAGVKILDAPVAWIALDHFSGSRTEFRLVEEPANPADPNAIRVEWWSPRLVEWVLVGYVPATVAANMRAEDYDVSLADVLTPNGRGSTGLPTGLRLRLRPRAGL